MSGAKNPGFPKECKITRNGKMKKKRDKGGNKISLQSSGWGIMDQNYGKIHTPVQKELKT